MRLSLGVPCVSRGEGKPLAQLRQKRQYRPIPGSCQEPAHRAIATNHEQNSLGFLNIGALAVGAQPSSSNRLGELTREKRILPIGHRFRLDREQQNRRSILGPLRERLVPHPAGHSDVASRG